MGRMVGLSWISSTLGKFRNRTFGSSLLNFLAIRISLAEMSCVAPPASASSIRTEIRRTHCSALPRRVLQPCKLLKIKYSVAKATEYFMGRLMGFEPMHIGTTIRGLNHLATPAIHIIIISKKIIFIKKKSVNII